jgi:hypothetical protein
VLEIALIIPVALAVVLLAAGFLIGLFIAALTESPSGHDHIDETRRMWRVMNWLGRVVIWPWLAIHAMGYLLGIETIRTIQELWKAVFYKR